MAKKHNNLLKAPSNAIVDALKESNERVKKLEAEVAKLKKELSKYKTQNAKSRQRMKSLEGQLKAEQAKVITLQKGLKIQKQKAKRAEAKQKEAELETQALKNIIKEIQPKMSKEQLFEFYRISNYNRFGERITQIIEIDAKKLAEMQAHMSNGDSQTLRDVIRIANGRSTWYDSDAEWNSSELIGGNEETIYAFIMSY